MPLHINIQDLIAGRTVESDRIEYKKGWNPGSIYRNICAFANDIEDIGGGYIIVGIEEKNGKQQAAWRLSERTGFDRGQSNGHSYYQKGAYKQWVARS